MGNLFTRLFFILLFSVQLSGFGEGTKQVRPTSATFGELYIVNNNNYPNFALYGCASNYRLYIHISNVNETILFGLRRLSTGVPPPPNRNYQLRDPSGTVVKSGACPNVSTDLGYIASYDAACAGPFPSGGGYDPLVYKVTDPTKVGDYYLEFSGDIRFIYYDFQVVSGAHDPAQISDTINGRVFSQAWQFYADLNTDPIQDFSAHMYVYSDDGIVTKCEYDGAHVGAFTMFCNQYGCLNTGNFASDRISKDYNTYTTFPGIAQYKVFFNNPDPTVYPNGVYGSLVGTPTIEYDPAYPICSGRKKITVVVNKAGNVNVKITVPYGSPATDVNITNPVVSGTNVVYWDGKDGLGNTVPDGTQITFQITYLNGLTNLPLWDVENNPEGFKITLVRPVNPDGQTPLTYWDDSGTNGCPTPNTSNLTGCTPTVTTGCHVWQPVINGPCHNKMINTWWYSASTSTATLSINQVMTPPPPTSTGPFNRCGTGDVNLVATVLPGEEVRWWDMPSGGTYLGTSQSGVPFPRTLATLGTFHFYAEAYNPTPPYFCTSATRTDVVANAFPIPNAPAAASPVSRCGTGSVTISATPGTGERIDWYDSPTGGILLGTGNNYTTPSLPAPSSTIFYAEAVTIGTSCVSPTRTPVTAIAKIIPQISVTPANSTQCSGQTTNILLQSDITDAVITWSAINCVNIACPPGGSGPPGTVIADLLNLTDFALPGSLTYQILATYDGCPSPLFSHLVTINPFPPVSLNDFTPVCFNSGAFALTGGSPAGGTYSGTGVSGGIFDPATAGIGTFTITYTYTESSTGCISSVSKPITVNPVPNVVPAVPSPLTICSGTDAQVALSSTVAGTETSTTFAWTASGNGATITPNPSTISGTGNILQNLANSGNILEPVVFHIMPTSKGCSPASPTDFTFNVNPVPSVSSSPASPQVICSATASSPVSLSTNVTGITPTYNWSSACDPGITSCPPATGSGTPIATFSPVNTTTSQKNVSFSITASLAASSGTCTGPAAAYTVKVNARPNITNTVFSQEVCSGLQSTAVALTADITGTTFAWTSSATAGITGNTPSGSGNIPIQTLLNSTPVQGSVTYTITPSFLQDGISCTGPVKTYTIYVNPLPVPTATGPVSVCEGTPGSLYNTQAGMASYSWTVSPAGTITAGGTSTSSSVTVTWNTALPGQFIEVNYVDPKGCTATSPFHLNVTVNPTPVLAVTGTNDLCAGTTGITYSTTPGMTSYGWTISAGGTPVGSTTSSSVTVNWAANAPASQSVSVAYTNSLGCSGLTLYPVTIRPLPVSTFTGTTTVCQLNPSPYLYTADAGPACSYTWSINPASYGTIANAAVSPASITWNTPGGATLGLSAVTTFGCSTSSSQPIVINPRPDVSITPCFDVVTNRSAKQFLLKGGKPLLTTTPLQGEYIITPATPALTSDVAGNFWFNPAMVPGTNTVTFSLSYKYTSSQFGCPATSPTSVTLTVRAANPPCGTSMTDYRDNTTYRTSFVAGRCWMMENLRYGTPLSPITTAQTDNCTTEKYCLASDATCTTYGGLYQWDELIQYGITAGPEYQGVCPAGWHIPTAADYQALIDANQGNGIAGSFLTDPNLTPRGFEALARGMAYLNTAWAFTVADIPSGTLFWTSTPGSGNRIITRGMNSKVPSVQYYEAIKADAFPVRCVKD